MDAPFTPWPEDVAADYRARGLWTGETFAQLLDRLAEVHGDRVAVVDKVDRLSFAELRLRSIQVARGLHDNGIRCGDTVVLQAHNTHQYPVVLFALFRLGAVPVCALPAHRGAEIGYFCAHTKAKAYVHPGDAEHHKTAAAAVDQTATAVHTVGEIAALAGAVTEPLPEPDSADVALLQLSGGSTGVPKLIPRTHDDYMYSVRAAAEACQVSTETVYLCALPAAHNFPLSSPGILGVLYAGGRVVMAPDPSPDTAFDLIDAESVTMTALVPALATAWMNAAANRERTLPSLQTLQVGGARLDPAQARRVEPTLGAQLQQVFGMAEGLVCYTRHDDSADVIETTQGRPASSDDEIRLVDDDDSPVHEGHSGHLQTRGPYTVRGYYRADAHNAVAFTHDGFYRTGDLARLAADGSIVVTGRAKDQVNRGGEKISAPEVEEHLRTHPHVLDAALIAVDDEVLGERSCAVCVRADEEVSPAQLRAHLRARGLAGYKIPDMIRFVARLPRTAIGKVDKNLLKETVHA